MLGFAVVEQTTGSVFVRDGDGDKGISGSDFQKGDWRKEVRS